MSGSSPQALLNQREEIGKQLRALSSKHTNNLTTNNRETFDKLRTQWSNIDGKLHGATLAYIHTLLYNPNSHTIKSKNNLQKVINGLSKNSFNTNAGPILAMYKDYLTKTNLASNTGLAAKNALALELAAERNALKLTLANKNAALQAALEGRTADAAAFEAKAKANIERMQAAHAAAVSNLERNKQTKLLELAAEKKAIELEAKQHKEAANAATKLANQTALNLKAAIVSGNVEAKKAAQLAANIAQRNLEATERNAKIAAAEAALVNAQQKAAEARAENKAAAEQALANKQAEFNRQLTANKAAANRALANARAAAAANRNSLVAKAAANKAAADQAAAEAAQKVSQLEAAVTAGQANKEAALAAAKRNANAAQAKANQEAANLRKQLGNKSAEANRLAGSLASTSGALANSHRRYAQLALQSLKAAAEAREARMKTLAAEAAAAAAIGNASKARAVANAHKAEANAAKQAAINAAAATEAAKRNAALASERAAAAEGNAVAQRQAAEASAAAVAAAQAEQQTAKEALEALKESSSATQAQLNAAKAAINAANANKRATANKHAANMAKLKANANKGKAAAIEGLRAARAANKAAANKALANLKMASAKNVTNLQNALKRLNAQRQAELEAKGTEKEAAVAAARIAAEGIAAARLRALQNNLNKAKQEAANIIQQKDSNLSAQQKAAQAQVAQLETELSKAKTLVGAATLTGMALGRAGGSVVGGITRLAGLGRQVAGPNTGRKNVPPTGLGTVTPLPLRAENHPLVKRVRNTLALIGNKGNKNTRSYVTKNSNALVKSPNNNKLQKEFVRAISQWALSSTVKPNKPELREWVKSKNVSISNFNTFVKNYLGKLYTMTNNPLYKTTNQNNPLFNKNAVNNSKALVVRTPNVVPASAGPNFTNITVRWLNNWKRYSNDELIKGVPGASVNGKVNPATASGQTRLKLLNIVRNANKNKIVFGKPGAISYFVKKYKNGGEKDPYLRWLIETMIGPQIMAFKNSNNYTRALQWVRKVHGINAGTLNVNKYNQYINNSYLPNGLKQALLKHKQEILNKRTVLGNSTVPGVPSISTSGSTIGYNKAQWDVIRRRPYMKSNKIERRGNLLKNKKTKAGYIYNENTRKILPVKTMTGSLYIANNSKSWPKNTSGFKL